MTRGECATSAVHHKVGHNKQRRHPLYGTHHSARRRRSAWRQHTSGSSHSAAPVIFARGSTATARSELTGASPPPKDPPAGRPCGLPGGGAPREVTHEELSAPRRAYYSNNHPDIVLPRLGRSGKTRICILNCHSTPCHAMPHSHAPPQQPLTWWRGSGTATLTRCHAPHRQNRYTAPGGAGRCSGTHFRG